MKFKSIAIWPKGTMGGYNNDVSEDNHDTREQAQAICDKLHCEGFGGAGRVFPIRTKVVPILNETEKNIELEQQVCDELGCEFATLG